MLRFGALFHLNKEQGFTAPRNQVNFAGACLEAPGENMVARQNQIESNPYFRTPPGFLGTLSGFLRSVMAHIYFNDRPSA